MLSITTGPSIGPFVQPTMVQHPVVINTYNPLDYANQQNNFINRNPNYNQAQAQEPGTYFPPIGGEMGDFATHTIKSMGLKGAQHVFSKGTTVGRQWLHSLKYYFCVNNLYVINKLKIILFPIFHKSFSRTMTEAEYGPEYLPPSQDKNAPDLYVPLMAFITYVLVIGFFFGSMLKFSPEVIGNAASTGLVTLSLEVFLIRLGFYLLSFPSISVLDIYAFSGYKFVGLVINILAGLFLGAWAYWLILSLNSLSMSIFMVKTYRLVIPKPTETSATIKRNYFLIFIAVLQLTVAFFLCYFDFKMKQ